MGPELFEIEGEFTKIVIKPSSTYVISKNPELCKALIEKYEVGRSQDYYFLSEDEAIRRGL